MSCEPIINRYSMELCVGINTFTSLRWGGGGGGGGGG